MSKHVSIPRNVTDDKRAKRLITNESLDESDGYKGYRMAKAKALIGAASYGVNESVELNGRRG